MTFYILLSSVAILTTIVGCALIWGYDVARAREIERGFPPPVHPEIAGAEAAAELPPPATD